MPNNSRRIPSFVVVILVVLTAVGSSLFAQVAPVAAGKDFKDQSLKDRSFKDATLNDADFSESTLQGVDFTNASLKKANFQGAQFKSVTGGNANFTEADFREITTLLGYYSEANFSKANLEGVEMKGYFFRTIFRGANLKNTKGWSTLGGGVDFSGADVRGANFRAAQITEHDRFRGAIYDEDTSWPENFDPKAAGCKLAEE